LEVDDCAGAFVVQFAGNFRQSADENTPRSKPLFLIVARNSQLTEFDIHTHIQFPCFWDGDSPAMTPDVAISRFESSLLRSTSSSR
jgi:hypothetical protein